MTLPRSLDESADSGSGQARIGPVVVGTLAMLAIVGPMTMDLYLPAFPRIAADLGATTGEIQVSLSAALIGVAAGQLLFGSMSDSVGRKVPLLAATGVHVAASAAIMAVDSVEWMLALRVLQGLGAAGGAVVSVAIARDAFEGKVLVRVLARLSLLSGLAPVAAPFLGSLLLQVTDWRGLFGALSLYGLLMSVLCLGIIPETLIRRRDAAGQESVKVSLRFIFVLKDRGFQGAAVIGAMFCTGVFAYLSASPFIFQVTYSLDPGSYGLVFAVNASAFALGSQLSSRLIQRVPPASALMWALTCAISSSLVIVLVDVLRLGVVCFAGAMFVFLFTAGLSLPIVQVAALHQHGQQAGTAAAALGCANFAVASLASPLSSLGGTGSPLATGVVIGVASIIGTAVCWRVFRRQQAKQQLPL